MDSAQKETNNGKLRAKKKGKRDSKLLTVKSRKNHRKSDNKQDSIEENNQLITNLQSEFNCKKKTLRNMSAHKAMERLARRRGMMNPFQDDQTDSKDSGIDIVRMRLRMRTK